MHVNGQMSSCATHKDPRLCLTRNTDTCTFPLYRTHLFSLKSIRFKVSHATRKALKLGYIRLAITECRRTLERWNVVISANYESNILSIDEIMKAQEEIWKHRICMAMELMVDAVQVTFSWIKGINWKFWWEI